MWTTVTLIYPNHLFIYLSYNNIYAIHVNICDVFHRVSFSIFTSLSLCKTFCGLEHKLELPLAIPVHTGANFFMSSNLNWHIYGFHKIWKLGNNSNLAQVITQTRNVITFNKQINNMVFAMQIKVRCVLFKRVFTTALENKWIHIL